MVQAEHPVPWTGDASLQPCFEHSRAVQYMHAEPVPHSRPPPAALPAFPPVPLPLATPAAQVDARVLIRELLCQCFGLVLALKEACLPHLDGRRLLLRVTATNTLDAEAQEEQLAYHCFRVGCCAVLCCAAMHVELESTEWGTGGQQQVWLRTVAVVSCVIW